MLGWRALAFPPGFWADSKRAFQEQERGQKRRARAEYLHGNPTCMCCHRDSLPGPEPGGTFALGLNDGDDFSYGCSGENIFAVSAVENHACLPTSACVIVAKLANCRVQTPAGINERISTMLERVVVFVAVGAKPLVFSEEISASGG